MSGGGRLKIHETTTPAGALAGIFLTCEEGALALVDEGDDDGPLALPSGALDAVMARFGAPMDPTERLTAIAALDTGDGGTLRHVRHLARYDVIARDYLVQERPGEEARCALATTVAGALGHLARAALGA